MLLRGREADILARASEALMNAAVPLSYENLGDIKLGQLSCRSQSAIKE